MHKQEVEDLYADFGGRVRALREQAGLRQHDVAAQLGLTRGSIANLEAGRQRPPLHQVYLLARVLGAHVIDLLPADDVDPDVTRHEQLRTRLLDAAAAQ